MVKSTVSNEYMVLRNFVTTFQGDVIAECFADVPVKIVMDCGETVMFQTNEGELVSVYSSKLKPQYKPVMEVKIYPISSLF